MTLRSFFTLLTPEMAFAISSARADCLLDSTVPDKCTTPSVVSTFTLREGTISSASNFALISLVTAVSPKAFEQALGMVRRGGTISLNGLPPGDFPLPIFSMVLKGITVRGSIVGTRLDLQESLDFAAQGKVKATVSTDKLENINDIFARMHEGKIEGRVVLDIAA